MARSPACRDLREPNSAELSHRSFPPRRETFTAARQKLYKRGRTIHAFTGRNWNSHFPEKRSSGDDSTLKRCATVGVRQADRLARQAPPRLRRRAGPTLAPTGPRLAPTGPRLAPTGPTLAPTGPTLAPSGPTLAPTGPRLAPTGPRLAPKGPKPAPRGQSLAPNARRFARSVPPRVRLQRPLARTGPAHVRAPGSEPVRRVVLRTGIEREDRKTGSFEAFRRTP